MHKTDNGRGPALAELRGRLEDARARARLNQTELAGKAGLSRGTVSRALSPGGGIPTVQTVARLAGALKLSVGKLLELQRSAVEESDGHLADMPGPGRPVGQWEPYGLEVHPAGPGTMADGEQALPGYVARSHDEVLAEEVRQAAQGRSRIVILVGSSSTGKTRACWQAVQPLAKTRWRLWHPFDPTRAEAALEDLHQVGPRTVVWLNEAQHYFGDRASGERIAAAVHRLLTEEERGPVLVLGTLWPEYADRYTALPAPGGDDPHSRVRELLTGRTVAVPDAFDAAALAAATVLADRGDALLSDALTRARDGGRITQELAGAPELLRRYEQSTPLARALLHAAMDARRLGVGLHLPLTFLTDAAPDYLAEDDYDQLTDDLFEQAYAELATPAHGKQAPLRRVRPRPQRRPPGPSQPADHPSPQPVGTMFRLADYLEQHGRTTRRGLCPPASFWDAGYTQLPHPDDLYNLAHAATSRHRLQWAHHLRLRAAEAGNTHALGELSQMREAAGDREGAETLANRAANAGNTHALTNLARMRKDVGDHDAAEALYQQAADAGNTHALGELVWIKEASGDREGAEALARRATDAGDFNMLTNLAYKRSMAGDHDSAEALYRQAVNAGDTHALILLAHRRDMAGDHDEAEALYQQASRTSEGYVLGILARIRDEAGDRDEAEALAMRAAFHDPNNDAVGWVALTRELAGDHEGAKALAQRAADAGNTHALTWLALRRESAGDHDEAEALANRAADAGNAHALAVVAGIRKLAGDRDGAEALFRHAADAGDIDAMVHLARMREEGGSHDEAEALALRAAQAGDARGVGVLSRMREEAGNHDSAEALCQQAANTGSSLNGEGGYQDRWPHGLDPDGTPTCRW
ncbi:helix-turn-helix domain-containing protein [Streptomyces sp. ID05-39B]|uniref:helix-turn-helix domain-containing protein n=1 Tax=Streptomyces sp. ID05-39B TaxID=3028664 RepID=UPI0029BC2570|nr:helix-turn-helix domain-containing protein [Streptomyces sp. ID05-39B]MDX3526930.1 helix-turn-helix domain-containing protein [Streptomyces sp. ID05-39B]